MNKANHFEFKGGAGLGEDENLHQISEEEKDRRRAAETAKQDSRDFKTTSRDQETTESISPETVDLVKKELGSQLKMFYSTIKKRYSDKDAGWTPAKLEVDSPKVLGPIILEWRNILRDGGAAEPDRLINNLIEVAQNVAWQGKLEHEFLDKALNHRNMEYNSDLEKLYRFLAIGLEKRAVKKETA